MKIKILRLISLLTLTILTMVVLAAYMTLDLFRKLEERHEQRKKKRDG